MTFDKFLKRNEVLADHLARIAAHRGAEGWVDGWTPVDSVFRDVLAAQERLLTAAERLLENCTGLSADVLPASNEPVDTTILPVAIDASTSPMLRLMSAADMSTAH